jgi:hypothetical protein
MYFAFNNPKKLALKENSGKIISFAGTITSEPLIKDFLQTFTLKTDNGDFVRVGADRYGELRYGDKVKVTGKLSAPTSEISNGGILKIPSSPMCTMFRANRLCWLVLFVYFFPSSKSRHTELRQYLMPVFVGPSLKTCPR